MKYMNSIYLDIYKNVECMNVNEDSNNSVIDETKYTEILVEITKQHFNGHSNMIDQKMIRI